MPPHREDLAIEVTDYYTEARLVMERMAQLYRDLYGVSSAGMRFFSVYGPKEDAKKQYANMITQFLWQLQDGKTPLVYGDGLQTRDFTFVKDVVRALRLAMHSDYHGILNVGTGKAYSFNEVIEILNRKLGSDRMPEYMANPISNYVSHTLADTSKAEKEIGFRAQISLEAGIDAIINSYSPTTDPNIS